MQLRIAAIAAGLASALCTGAAYAQSNPAYPAVQQAPAGPQNQARTGKRAQINADVRAGRISKSEGKQLKQQLKAEKAQRRAQKQARRAQRGYQPANYSLPPSPQQ
jgi:hypothetical protein